MILARPYARNYLTWVAVIFACLLNACSYVSPTRDVIFTDLPVTELPVPSSTTALSLVPVIGNQDATSIVKTPILTQTQQLTPSRTVIPSDTPPATETIVPTPTPTPPIIWGAGVPMPIIIEQYRGYWLSLQHKLVGNYLGSFEFRALALASEPRFIPDTIQTGTPRVLGSVFSTNPNGRWILLGSVPFQEYVPGLNEISTLTRLNPQDGRLQAILPDQGELRWLSFLGWLDGNTVAVSDYAGGGYYNYSMIDTTNNILLTKVQAHGPAWRPNPTYLPLAEEYGGPYQLYVLDRFVQTNPLNPFLGSNEHIRGFPSEYIGTDMNTIFKDWLPDTNLMLVQNFAFNRNSYKTTQSQLMLWNVDSAVVQVMVNGALDGVFSPDGKMLAFVTLGAAPLNAEGQPSFDQGPQVPQISQAYLQLMDINSRNVLFSLPALTTTNQSMRFTLDVYDTPLIFSSDSRYIAFATPGLLIADQAGKLIVLPVNQESSPYLSVMDITNFQPLLSTPLGNIDEFYFSPANDRLIFRGKEGNWYILLLGSSQVQAVTVAGGERLHWNGWSYDGYYFSFFQPDESDLGRTLIVGTNP